MLFYGNSECAKRLHHELKLDPMVIRHSYVKAGTSLKDQVPPSLSRTELERRVDTHQA